MAGRVFNYLGDPSGVLYAGDNGRGVIKALHFEPRIAVLDVVVLGPHWLDCGHYLVLDSWPGPRGVQRALLERWLPAVYVGGQTWRGRRLIERSPSGWPSEVLGSMRD